MIEDPTHEEGQSGQVDAPATEPRGQNETASLTETSTPTETAPLVDTPGPTDTPAPGETAPPTDTPARASADEQEAERERELRRLTDSGRVIDREQYTARSRRSFLTFGAAGIAGYLGFRAVRNQSRSDGVPGFVRGGLNWNERVWGTIERDGADGRSFDASDVEDLRVNGRHGVESDLPADYAITVSGVGGSSLATLSVADIQALPVHDMVWRHKCVEGWSNVVGWTGVRFSDFVRAFAPDEDGWDHVALTTPDGDYYVGVDRYTMLHDQTLLAWKLNGQELTPEHGAPLRLATPLKYGIKQLKRIGTIEFTVGRPADYWFERGYDYHAGF